MKIQILALIAACAFCLGYTAPAAHAGAPAQPNAAAQSNAAGQQNTPAQPDAVAQPDLSGLPNGAEFAAAIQLFYQQDWPQAIDAFQKIVDKDPRDTMSWFYLVDGYIKRNDLHTELYQLEQKTMQTDNKNATALAELGIGYIARYMKEQQASILEEAQKTLEKSLEIDKNNSLAHSALGLVYHIKRMMPRAKGHFIEAFRNNPNDLMALERIGEITLVDEKRPKEAIELFEQIVHKAPTYPDGYWYVGSSYYDLGDWDKCIEYMEKVMTLDPKGVTQGFHAPMLMGKAYMKKKDYADAATAFRKMLQIDPNSKEATFLLSQAESGERGTPSAAPDRNKQKNKRPKNPPKTDDSNPAPSPQ